MRKKLLFVVTMIYLFLAGCVTDSVPMEQYLAAQNQTRNQVTTLNRRIADLEAQQGVLKNKIHELKVAETQLPTGIAVIPSPRRDAGAGAAPAASKPTPLQMAVARYRAGDIAGGIGDLQRLLDASTSNRDTVIIEYWLGDAYYAQRNFDRASRYLNAYLKADGKGSHAKTAMEKLIQSLRALGRKDDADSLETQGISALR